MFDIRRRKIQLRGDLREEQGWTVLIESCLNYEIIGHSIIVVNGLFSFVH